MVVPEGSSYEEDTGPAEQRPDREEVYVDAPGRVIWRKVVLPEHELETEPVEVRAVRGEEDDRVGVAQLGDLGDFEPVIFELAVALSVESVDAAGGQVDHIRAVGGRDLPEVLLRPCPGLVLVEAALLDEPVNLIDELTAGEDGLCHESRDLVAVSLKPPLSLIQDTPGAAGGVPGLTVDLARCLVVLGQICGICPCRGHQLYPTGSEGADPMGAKTLRIPGVPWPKCVQPPH